MNGNEKILVLLDREQEYVQLFTEYLNRKKNLPWRVMSFTDPVILSESGLPEIEILLVAESTYDSNLKKLPYKKLVVLSESGLMKWEDTAYIGKYQKAEEVYRQLMEQYMEIADTFLPALGQVAKTTFLGVYTPVHRTMQTSFALTMSQILAKEKRTLYLNFEQYIGMTELIPERQSLDLSDLLYFLHGENEKFQYRLQTMLRHVGNMDLILPMKSGQNLFTVTREEWLELFGKLESLGEYDYVVLDLGECMQGLFDILRICSRVYTMTADDRMARCKLDQYEQLLALYHFEDVKEKTEFCSLSHIHRIPQEIQQLTKGELAQYVTHLVENI